MCGSVFDVRLCYLKRRKDVLGEILTPNVVRKAALFHYAEHRGRDGGEDEKLPVLRGFGREFPEYVDAARVDRIRAWDVDSWCDNLRRGTRAVHSPFGLCTNPDRGSRLWPLASNSPGDDIRFALDLFHVLRAIYARAR